ncbi:beta-1,3-galactosyl-O-glycosyl-glycoprotein beta-1,6-N-acetylglucosaminyltransferase 3-like [Hyperolius riggenbachi]|uniref:beta-1,3-galactosyl-O-glycosyl-glycoprotein beta-1,6-N-acetylglucosaminyltransferase 3-like n=1 Tax=Hyperolius riggenbachi TaxID=752182 RepID=UPI0035A28942
MFGFPKKLWRINTGLYLICGSILFLFTIVLKFTSLDCYLNDARQIIDLNTAACRDHYYKAFNLSASGKKNCTKIIEGDWDEVRQTLIENLEVKKRKVIASDKDYIELAKDCATFKTVRKYITFRLSTEEANYPIAYSMVVHGDIEAFERLLRSIYTPQNIYCVHVDAKSPDTFHQALRAIVSCFDNVFVASKLESVVYASWSRVQADLNCMEDLLNSTVQWKYLINTCGSDFPLKTNAEIVKTLKSLNGKNNMESEEPPVGKKWRWESRFEVKENIVNTNIKKSSPPLNINIFSGNAYIVVTRDFVRAVFETSFAKDFIEWAKDTYSPDEFLWASLHRVPWMPGSFPRHSKFDTSDMNAVARLVKWGSLEGDIQSGAPYSSCTGIHRREVCVYGTGDLHWLLQQHHLFANKFDPKVDDHALQCLEEQLRFKSFYGNIM